MYVNLLVAAKKDVFCPSGKLCPLEGGTVPWAFLPTEITHILSTYTAPKYNHDRSAHREERALADKLVASDRVLPERSMTDRPLAERALTDRILPAASSADRSIPEPVINSGNDDKGGSSNDRLSAKVKQERESVG